MILVALSFVLKLTNHSLAATAGISAVAALFVWLCTDFAAGQSKARIADWLGDSALMLDTAVILTVDVALQLVFCLLWVRRQCDPVMPRWLSVAYAVVWWVPGVLVFPVLLSVLVEAVFSLPGVDFDTVGAVTAGCVLILFPLAAIGMKALVDDPWTRVELMFLVNLIIAGLGVVVTVNGRTAAAGTATVEWGALAGVFALVAAGAVAGLAVQKHRLKKLKF